MGDEYQVVLNAYRVLLAILDDKLGKELADTLKKEVGHELSNALDAAHESRKRALEWPRPIG